MKKVITLLTVLLISISSFAQQGINYKAVLKDASGNLLGDTFMNVQFTIHQSTATGTIVYQEDHNYTTDANGLLILNIGTDTGPSVGVFTDIEWGADLHFLQTTITYSGGTIDFDATEFMAVPYALNAANVSGLEKITENNGTQDNTGWRLVGKDPEAYYSIGDDAVDLSQSSLTTNDFGAKGNFSFATGYASKAIGDYSVAFKSGTASGFASFASGGGSNAASYSGTVFGEYNVGNGNPNVWTETDPLFEIGNGSTPSRRRNALTLLKNGSLIAGSAQMDDDNTTPDDNARIFFNKAKGAFRAGLVDDTYWDDSEVGSYSVSMGLNTKAKGQNSFAMGGNSTAIGKDAVAMGGIATATGQNAISIGNQTNANGVTSVALGAGTISNGFYSTAMNLSTTADALASTAMGRNNIGTGDPANWVETDPLFEIGNSIDSNNKSNALTILKNGTITAPSFDITEITDDKALITKEYLEANGATGLEYLDETDDAIDNGGWRLKGFDPANYGPIGDGAVDLSYSDFISTSVGATGRQSTAMGYAATASGRQSTAMGDGTTASGVQSTAMGAYTTASGTQSTAMGNSATASAFISTAMGSGTMASGSRSTAMGASTTASGLSSTAMGSGTIASQEASTAMGLNTTASASASTSMGNSTSALGLNSTAMGQNTIATANSSTAIGKFNTSETDGLFMVGNGTGNGDRNNALIIRDNGNAQFDGEIQRTSTGSANMVPIAYGSFDGDDGTDPFDILSGTDNFTVTRAGDFTYTISVTGESLSASNATASVTVSTNFFRTANVTYSGGDMKVHIFSSTFNKVPAPFQFIIYKN